MSYPENQFNDVRRLLTCKRYEQPPPGYFASFSDRVISEIERDHARPYSSWWNWFVERFDAKPVLVCAYGLAVSSLLLLGFHLSQVFQAEMGPGANLALPWLAVTPGSPLLSPEPLDPVPGVAASPRSWLTRSTSAEVLFPASSLHFQPVNFSPVSQ